MLLGGGLWWRAVACCDYATFFGPKGTFVLASPREKLAEGLLPAPMRHAHLAGDTKICRLLIGTNTDQRKGI